MNERREQLGRLQRGVHGGHEIVFPALFRFPQRPHDFGMGGFDFLPDQAPAHVIVAFLLAEALAVHGGIFRGTTS